MLGLGVKGLTVFLQVVCFPGVLQTMLNMVMDHLPEALSLTTEQVFPHVVIASLE